MKSKIVTGRKLWGMAAGVVILSAGIAIFRHSGMGNDSANAMLFRISEITGFPFSRVLIVTNLAYFILEFLLGRRYIGVGTFVNWLGCGYVITFCCRFLDSVFGRVHSFSAQLMWIVMGILIISLGISLYQTANLGIAPYDSLALLVRDYGKLPYFLSRITVDGICGLICWGLGGYLGLGTFICVFCLGPFVSFFNRYVSQPLLEDTKEIQSLEEGQKVSL